MFCDKFVVRIFVPLVLREAEENVLRFQVKLHHNFITSISNVNQFQLHVSHNSLRCLPVLRGRISFSVLLAPQYHLLSHHVRNFRIFVYARRNEGNSIISTFISKGRPVKYLKFNKRKMLFIKRKTQKISLDKIISHKPL